MVLKVTYVEKKESRPCAGVPCLVGNKNRTDKKLSSNVTSIIMSGTGRSGLE